jgi:hypothetical protein
MKIPSNTIYCWKIRDRKRGEDWDKEREAMHDESANAPKQMLKAALESLAPVIKEMRTEKRINPKEISAIRQLILTAKAIQKNADPPGSIIFCMTEFTDFLAARNWELHHSLEQYLLEFGTEMSKKHGKSQPPI